MNDELKTFLTRHNADSDLIHRLESLGVETLEQAWDKASDDDLIWAITREGVMDEEQRRQFLVGSVLEPIENLLTDPRSKNILAKLRTNEPITDEDRDAAFAAATATWARADAAFAATWARAAARAAAWATAWARAATWEATWEAANAAARAATWEAAWANAAFAATWAAAKAWAAANAAARARADAAKAWAAARAAQAQWVRDNFKLQDLNTK